MARYLVGVTIVVMLACGAVAAEVLAHPDGCHRWHSCESDDGSYVCGDLGHCSECRDNRYCIAGRSRSATTAATRTPRPTRTPDATRVPRATQTPDAPRAGRSAGANDSTASRTSNNAADLARSGVDAGRAGASADGDATDPQGDLRDVGALTGTGAPLGAAPPRAGGAPSAVRAPGGSEGRSAPVVVAEYAGVRVIGPLQLAPEGERPSVTGVVYNSGAQPRSMLLTLILLDGQGTRLGSSEVVLWDIAPGESRPFAHEPLSLQGLATDVSARLDPVVP